MDSHHIDIISLIVLIIGIIFMYNNSIYIKKLIYLILIVGIIDLRVFLRTL